MYKYIMIYPSIYIYIYIYMYYIMLYTHLDPPHDILLGPPTKPTFSLS